MDPGLQLGFESDYYLCVFEIIDYVHQVKFCSIESAAGGAKHKVLHHSCHVKEVVEAELSAMHSTELLMSSSCRITVQIKRNRDLSNIDQP